MHISRKIKEAPVSKKHWKTGAFGSRLANPQLIP